jgi:hypothetical protein
MANQIDTECLSWARFKTMDGEVNYFDKAQRVLKAVNRLLGTAQQMFDAAYELRKRQADESLPFEERYRATILIEDHLDLADRLIRRGANLARTPEFA